MPVKIQLIDQKINDQFHNGVDFETNKDTSFAPNLVGIAGERVRVRQTVAITSYLDASASNKFFFDQGITQASVDIQTGNWFNEGFAVGDQIEIVSPTYGSITTNIASLSETTLIATTTGTLIPTGSYTDLSVINKEQPKFLDYKAGLVDNGETGSFISLETGEDQRWYANDISTSFVNLLPSGVIRSFTDGDLKVKYLNSYYNSAGKFFFSFEISHELILPYYRDGDFDQLANRLPLDIYAGDATLKYTNNYSFQTTKSNPTGAKVATLDYTLGSCGGFGETFNGFQSDYEITDIDYIDAEALVPIVSLKAVGRTEVTIRATKLVGTWAVGDKVGVYSSYLPQADEYTAKTTGFVENFMYENAFNLIGSAPINSGYIYGLSIALIDPTNIEITFDIELSTAQSLRLFGSTNSNYLIGVQMGDVTKLLPSSDKVIELADVSTFSNELILKGLSNAESIRIWEHNEDYLTDAGHTSFIGWIEDGLLARFKFNVDLSKSVQILSIAQKVIAYDPANPLDYFEIDKTTIAIGDAPVVNGVQEIEVNKTKGYKLANADPFNKLEVHTLARVGDLQSYEILHGQKIPWQDWQKIKANSIFYDKTKPQNGFNRKASNYSDINDFTIRFAYSIVLFGIDEQGRSGITEYIYTSPAIESRDYEKPTEAWECNIETFDPETMTNLGKLVYEDKETLFRITWGDGSVITDETQYYAINRIEPFNQGGFNKPELSSIVAPANNNPLIPLTGLTNLKLYAYAGELVAECLIDPTYINVSAGINLSGRIAKTEGMPDGVKLMEDGTPKLMEIDNETYKILD